jgi:hypothetical protein
MDYARGVGLSWCSPPVRLSVIAPTMADNTVGAVWPDRICFEIALIPRPLVLVFY